LRILHSYKDYYPVIGGIEHHIGWLAEAQAKAGYSVSVVVTNPGGLPRREIWHGVNVVRVRRLLSVFSTPISLEFPWAMARERPQIAHLHFPYPLGEVSQWIAGRRWPYVITYHSDVVNPRQQVILRLYRPLMVHLLQRAGAVIATSPNYVATSSILKTLEDRCTVIPLGIHPEPYLQAEPSIPEAEAPSLLFVGRLRYYKGVDVLLQAMTQLPQQVRLLIVGDGPMRRIWESMAAKLSLEDRVTFLGEVPVDELPGIYASAEVFVLPSTERAEAFGLVLLEAMAAGLPCVTTEVGTGTSFVVRDGVTGLVVPPRSSSALAEAVDRLLADAGLRREMGRAGQERVCQQFTVQQMARAVELVYRRVLESA
jgi:rhamnosyl/mannosyltransferase